VSPSNYTGIIGALTSSLGQQVAYVTPDIDAAVAAYESTLGGPRFLINRDVAPNDQTYLGKPAELVFHAALAYVGNIQIEIIQPVQGETIYNECIENRTSGLVYHHVGYESPSLESYWDTYRQIEQAGCPAAQTGVFGETVYAYFDFRSEIGTYLEIIWLDKPTRKMYDSIRDNTF
jgi:hypothetical protein